MAASLTVRAMGPAVSKCRFFGMMPARLTSRTRNPLTFTWQSVVRAGVPFVKRSLFLANPDRIELRGWREFIREQAPGFDVGVVDRDVLRLTGRAAP